MHQQRKNRVTILSVDGMQPGDVLWDQALPGFGVRCRKRTKSFVVFYRARETGFQRFVTIGRYGVLTVEQARQRARILLGEVAANKDPHGEFMRRKSAPTVREFAARFLEQHVRPKLKSGTAAEYDRLLHKRILPVLGTIRVDRLSERDVLRWHSALGKTPREANHAAAVLSRLMTFAEQQGERSKQTNPVRGLQRFREAARERYLTHDEFERLGRALKAAAADGLNSFAVAAVRLLIFTGARRGEILSLRWDYVDLDRKTLFLPDSKTGRKVIHLNAPAVEILRSLPRLDGNPYVICGAKPGLYLRDLMTPWQNIRARAALTDIRIHDLRHSFASMAASTGVPLAVLGRLVGHQTLRTTERYAHIFSASMKAANDEIGANLARALSPVGEDE